MYTTAQFPLVRMASARAEGGVRGMKMEVNYYTKDHREGTTLTLKLQCRLEATRSDLQKSFIQDKNLEHATKKSLPAFHSGRGAVDHCDGRGGEFNIYLSKG